MKKYFFSNKTDTVIYTCNKFISVGMDSKRDWDDLLRQEARCSFFQGEWESSLALGLRWCVKRGGSNGQIMYETGSRRVTHPWGGAAGHVKHGHTVSQTALTQHHPRPRAARRNKFCWLKQFSIDSRVLKYTYILSQILWSVPFFLLVYGILLEWKLAPCSLILVLQTAYKTVVCLHKYVNLFFFLDKKVLNSKFEVCVQ